MNQHASNPPGNRLPIGVEETPLVEAVQASGYPLQALVAQALSSDFRVVEEWGYTDRTTKHHRTLDVHAYCDLGTSTDKVRPGLALLVECKRSDLPLVFFPPGVQRVPWDFPEVVGVGRFSVRLDSKSTQDVSPSTFFCADDSGFVTIPRLAVSLTRVQRKGKQFELSGEVPFNQIVLPLTSAVEHVREVFRGISTLPMLVLSVCVVDATMIVASGTPEAPLLHLEPWVRVVHEESVQDDRHWVRRNYAVDFIHREFLTQYVRDHAIPFATTFAARIVRYMQLPLEKQGIRPLALEWDIFIGT